MATDTAAVNTSVEIGSLLDRKPTLHHGRPIIAGTGISVQNIAIYERWGYTPEEIARDKYLTLAQVHAALAYYYANKDDVDATIAQDQADYQKAEAEWRKMRCGYHHCREKSLLYRRADAPPH